MHKRLDLEFIISPKQLNGPKKTKPVIQLRSSKTSKLQTRTNHPIYKICIQASINKNAIRRLRWACVTVAVACVAGTLDGSGRTTARRERSWRVQCRLSIIRV